MSIIGKPQFSTGDQAYESRIAFFHLRFKQCIKCAGLKIKEEREVDGCRMNGDAYGTDVFTCADCGWFTSFQWDDASDTYYYETEKWPRKTDVRSESK